MRLPRGASALHSPRALALSPWPASTCPACLLSLPLDFRIPRSRPGTAPPPPPPCARGAGPAAAAAFFHTSRRQSSAWAAAVQVAGNMVSTAFARAAKGDMPTIDPLRIVAKEMQFLTGNLRKLLGSGHPSLDRVAKYYTQSDGKHVRPLIVLLMSRATALCPKSPSPRHQQQTLQASAAVDTSLSPLSILADSNPSAAAAVASPSSSSPSSSTASADPIDPVDSSSPPDILPSQRRLAEITELIHTASLLHDDVIDHSVSRRGSPSANLQFGNKMAVLAGDFLLGRASVALARLRHAEVLELLATVIANLVEGEFMQLKNTRDGGGGTTTKQSSAPTWTEDVMAYYLQKSYLKTASLISKSCRAAALLGGADAPTVDAAYAYGRNLGLAFQLVDDMLDYTRSGWDLGKPAGADLELGLATAPLLFAWESIPELGALVDRRFEGEGDVARARDLVMQSDGIARTKSMAEDYANRAISAISQFPDSDAKDGLIEMAVKTVMRQK